MGLKSVAYFVSWGIYARNFNVWNINPLGLTHINYAFANIGNNGSVVLGDAWADTDKVNTANGDSWSDPANYLHGNFHQLFLLKQRAPWIKTGISIGGWTWSGQFSTIAATDASRNTFVTSAINFMLNYGFDFVDLDWEYPVYGGLGGNARSPNDGKNLVLLLKEFKRQFALYPGRGMQVTCAVSCGLVTLVNYEIAEMDPYIDGYNMMCYDFTGSWSPVADHQSNLYPRDANVDSVVKAVDYAIAQGATTSKIVLGVPIYGRGFSATRGLNMSFMGVPQGSWEMGIYDYKALPLPECTALWEPVSNASFCYDPAGQILVSYDTPTSVSYKMKYILDKGLGGVMFWDLSSDYAFSDSQSLQAMIKTWLGPYMDTTASQKCYPMSPYANINSAPGCPKPQAGKDKSVDSFIPDAETLKGLDPLINPKNMPGLIYPRAHYNFSAFMHRFKDLTRDFEFAVRRKAADQSHQQPLPLMDAIPLDGAELQLQPPARPEQGARH